MVCSISPTYYIVCAPMHHATVDVYIIYIKYNNVYDVDAFTLLTKLLAIGATFI